LEEDPGNLRIATTGKRSKTFFFPFGAGEKSWKKEGWIKGGI